MNTRANIMYFVEHFMDAARKEGHSEYIHMMQRDIIRVVDAVAPDDGSGAANVRVVRKVLQSLQTKGHMEAQTVDQIEEVLKERETTADDLGLSSPNGDVETSETTPSQTIPRSGRRSVAPQRIDKRQVEQRIEEDRERHKRERESIWAIPVGADAEMNKLWEETSDWGDDDNRLVVEEAIEFTKEMDMRGCSHQKIPGGVGG